MDTALVRDLCFSHTGRVADTSHLLWQGFRAASYAQLSLGRSLSLALSCVCPDTLTVSETGACLRSWSRLWMLGSSRHQTITGVSASSVRLVVNKEKVTRYNFHRVLDWGEVKGQCSLNTGENCFSKEQEVGFLVRESNGYMIDTEWVKWERMHNDKMAMRECCWFHF